MAVNLDVSDFRRDLGKTIAAFGCQGSALSKASRSLLANSARATEREWEI